jgi:hypothetical protein
VLNFVASFVANFVEYPISPGENFDKTKFATKQGGSKVEGTAAANRDRSPVAALALCFLSSSFDFLHRESMFSPLAGRVLFIIWNRRRSQLKLA